MPMPYANITRDPEYFDQQADRLDLWASRAKTPQSRDRHTEDAGKTRKAAKSMRDWTSKRERRAARDAKMGL